jgi:hypothetical protein
MTTLGLVYLAFGLVTAAWIGKAVTPTPATNAAGWAIGLIGTLLLLLVALGVVVVR